MHRILLLSSHKGVTSPCATALQYILYSYWRAVATDSGSVTKPIMMHWRSCKLISVPNYSDSWDHWEMLWQLQERVTTSSTSITEKPLVLIVGANGIAYYGVYPIPASGILYRTVTNLSRNALNPLPQAFYLLVFFIIECAHPVLRSHTHVTNWNNGKVLICFLGFSRFSNVFLSFA